MAQAAVRESGNLSVPLHIRNAPTGLMKDFGYGKNYQYSHSYEGNFSAQEYLPDAIAGTVFYTPGTNAKENQVKTYLRGLWNEKYGY